MTHAFFFGVPLRLWCSCAGAMVQGLYGVMRPLRAARSSAAVRRSFSVLRRSPIAKHETRRLSLAAYAPPAYHAS